LVVGVLNITLHIGGVSSLKEKRRIIKSILERIHSKYRVAAAEKMCIRDRNYSDMGFSCVSNEASHAESVLSSVIRFIDNDARVEIIQSISESIHF